MVNRAKLSLVLGRRAGIRPGKSGRSTTAGAGLAATAAAATVAAATAVVMTACTSTRYAESDNVPTTPSPAASAPSAPAQDMAQRGAPAAPATAPAALPALTLNGYKRQVAQSIYRQNTERLFEGAPPPMLKSVIVLTIGISPDGHPVRVSVMRSNGYRELERVAMDSVRRAAPLPAPSRFVLAKNGTAEFVETWLFRDDGRFQIRSLAEAQAMSDPDD